MTSATRTSRVSPGTIISVLSVFLYCAGFVRVEWKLHEQNSRITALETKRASEDHLVQKDGSKGETQYNLHLTRLMRSRRDKNSVDNSTESLENLLKKLLKTIQERNMQRCPIGAHSCFRGAPGKPGSKGDRGTRGRRGPRGKTGRRGAAGPQGPRGRTGKQGMMGPAGRKGDKGDKGSQGIMGPTGLKGEKGEKGLQGLAGLKGDPGKSVSVPSVVISPPSQTANENSVAILYCSATGNPKPIIKWEKINGVLPENRYEASSSGELRLKQIRLGDAGVYQCEARNILGVSRAKSSIVVHDCKQASAVGAAYGGGLANSNFNGSSSYDERYLPKNGRLNHSHAWCQKSSGISPNEYLQVDLGARHWVCAVATQGNGEWADWTTKYKLKISNDGVSWHTYQQNGSDKEFDGNNDQNSVVRNNLPTLAILRFIRFYPTARHTHPCLRVEIYGLRADG